MKISARICNQLAKAPERPEPELEFYLEEDSTYVALKVWDKANDVKNNGYVLRIKKLTGRIHRIQGVNKLFGLPLTPDGKVKLNTED